jgi:hypothetical protein
MRQHWVRDIDRLHDFIAYVVVHAPDNFPKEDYLKENEQMTLETAFEELRRGVQLRNFAAADASCQLSAILDDALALYRTGEDVKGAHRIQDFERLIFKR